MFDCRRKQIICIWFYWHFAFIVITPLRAINNGLRYVEQANKQAPEYTT